MSTNDKLINKVDLAFNHWQSTNGLLNPEQASAFIRKLLVQPTLLNQVRRVEMNSPSRKIDKIQFGKRIMRSGTLGSVTGGEWVASGKATLDASTKHRDRAAPQNEQIVLNAREVIAEVHLNYENIEDSIERGNIGAMRETSGQNAGGGIVSTIMDLIAERAAIDLEELILLGDTASNDPYLQQFDGYLKICESGKRTGDTAPNITGGQTTDAGGSIPNRAMFKNGLKTLPSQYLRLRPQMRHFVSYENEMEYRDTLAARETSLGDSQHGAQLAPVYAGGVMVEPVGLMPQEKGILTMPQNLIMGIYRGMTIETDKDISARTWKIVMTMRLDVQVEETEAAVVYTGIGNSDD